MPPRGGHSIVAGRIDTRRPPSSRGPRSRRAGGRNGVPRSGAAGERRRSRASPRESAGPGAACSRDPGSFSLARRPALICASRKRVVRSRPEPLEPGLHAGVAAPGIVKTQRGPHARRRARTRRHPVIRPQALGMTGFEFGLTDCPGDAVSAHRAGDAGCVRLQIELREFAIGDSRHGEHGGPADRANNREKLPCRTGLRLPIPSFSLRPDHALRALRAAAKGRIRRPGPRPWCCRRDSNSRPLPYQPRAQQPTY